jgi:molecular chaperone GrpE
MSDAPGTDQPRAEETAETTDGGSAGAPDGEHTVTFVEFQTAQAKAQEYLDGWQRARAEFANYKKRAERDLRESQQTASGDVIQTLLPIIDDFDRAMSNVPGDLQGNAWLNGVALIQRKFMKLLDEYGVASIEPTGEAFDPTLHEAIGTDEATEAAPSGYVTATMQRGYKMGERVLRPALVRVAQ